jgi:hypothetical protein
MDEPATSIGHEGPDKTQAEKDMDILIEALRIRSDRERFLRAKQVTGPDGRNIANIYGIF